MREVVGDVQGGGEDCWGGVVGWFMHEALNLH